MLQWGDSVLNASSSRIKLEGSISERRGPVMFGRKGLHKLRRPRIVEAHCGIDAADQAEQAILQDVKSVFRNRPFDRGNEFDNLRIVHISPGYLPPTARSEREEEALRLTVRARSRSRVQHPSTGSAKGSFAKPWNFVVRVAFERAGIERKP